MNTTLGVSQEVIVEIAHECNTYGPGPDANDNDVVECVEDCIGRQVTDREKRLIMVAYNCDEETALRSIWYVA